MVRPTLLNRLQRAGHAFFTELVRSSPATIVELNAFWITGIQWVSRALYVVVKLGVVEILTRQPMTIEQLASETQCDCESLRRVMQTLTSAGLLQIDAKQQYHLTTTGEQLNQDAENSLHHWTILLSETWNEANLGMLEAVKTGKSGFEAVFGKSMWEHYAEHPEQRATFDRAMNEVTVWQGKVVAQTLDLRNVTRVIDVGAGNGSLVSALLHSRPTLEGVAMDRQQAEDSLRANLERQGVSSRCSVVAGSFFESADIPADGDAYFIKHVLHDWPDEQVVRILSACRDAMPKAAKLYVIEGLRGRSETIDFVLDCLDLEQMVVTAGGRERSQSDFARLLKQSGFHLESVTHTEVVDVSVIIATLD